MMQGSSELTAIIFDMGRVLVNVDVSIFSRKIFSDVAGDNPDEIIQEVISHPLMKKFNMGLMPPEQFYQELCDAYRLDVDYAEFTQLWCSLFSPMAGMEELLGELDGSLALGLLSDTDPLHWEHLTKTYSLLELFEHPTLSFQVEVMKPDPEIYLVAAKNVGVSPEQCLYIDDLQCNVEGARSVGMEGIRFEGATPLREQLVSRGLLQGLL